MALPQLIVRDPATVPTEPESTPEAATNRMSHLTSIVYLVVALAAPLIVYFGPDVLSPTAPVVANAALAGQFALHRPAKAREPRADAARARIGDGR